ncbi:MAG: GIY-YIG nuclease family protein [Candidatus Paceibacterota bacterium]
MAYFIYILECCDKTLYTGSTNDLEKRVLAHNTSKTAAKYTKARRPVTLKYFEKFRTKSKAMKRECAIKNLTRSEKLKLVKDFVIPAKAGIQKKFRGMTSS